MKKIVMLCLLGLFTFSHAQKRKKCMNNKEITFSTEKYLFYSDQDHGNKTAGFVILSNQEQLNQVLHSGQLFTLGEETQQNTLTFPKDQKVILYHFGEFRSGKHKAKGIDKIKLVEDTLEVYLTKEKEQKNINTSSLGDINSRIKVQIVTRPRMIFSIPEKLNFKTIVIK